MGLDAAAVVAWQHHWMTVGFSGVEALLSGNAATGRFCHGDTPGMADVFLVPQVRNARFVDFDLSPYPQLLRIDETCSEMAAFHAAAPENQPDAPPE